MALTLPSGARRKHSQQQDTPAAMEEGEWLRHANGLLLLNPAWVEVQQVLSGYIQDFVQDICERKPSVAQVMYDVVGHRLMEAAMGETFPYQPQQLEEPYMSKEVRQMMKRELQHALTEYLGRRVKKEGFFSLPSMTGFHKVMQTMYRARVREAGDVNISEQAGQALVYMLKHQKRETAGPPPSGGSSGIGIYVGGDDGGSPPGTPEVGGPGNQEEEEDEAEEDLWDVVEAEVLPPSVRRHLWARRLTDTRKEKIWQQDLQRYMLVNSKNPNRSSPIASLIASGVVQLLADVESVIDLPPSMAAALERLLDVHYSITGRYTRRYINLLLPILLVFPRGSTPSLHEEARLFNMLSLLYAQTDPQIMAQKATVLLHRRDPALEAHLDRLFFNQSLGTSSETIIKSEGEEAAVASMTPSEVRLSTLLTLATSVTALFRYWVEEAFLGILRPAALLFVWDNCLLIGWESQVPEFCVDVLCLMRDVLLECRTAQEAVLLMGEETRLILTEEIQTALKRRRGLLDDQGNDVYDDTEDDREEEEDEDDFGRG